MLLGSAVDLEAPAHTSEEFLVLVYPALDQGILKATLPIHGRYHKPSLAGKRFELVEIQLPKLILRTDTCELLCLYLLRITILPNFLQGDYAVSVNNINLWLLEVDQLILWQICLFLPL